MLLHVDTVKFKVKPTGQEIGGIKARFTKSASIKDMSAKQIAAALIAGKTVRCHSLFRRKQSQRLQRDKRRRF